MSPRAFSFNSPHGACERCTGLGSQMEIDVDLIVPDQSKSITEGAILPADLLAQPVMAQVFVETGEGITHRDYVTRAWTRNPIDIFVSLPA